MKKWKLLSLIPLFIFLFGCSSTQQILDDGRPGSIVVKVFIDENRNGLLDSGESGVLDRVAIAQDIACPAGDQTSMVIVETDSDGEYIFENLAPGKYCLMYMGGRGATTPVAFEGLLSSDQVVRIAFGLTE